MPDHINEIQKRLKRAYEKLAYWATTVRRLESERDQSRWQDKPTKHTKRTTDGGIP